MGFQKGNKIWTGRKHSKATLAKMRGKKLSVSHRKAISESRKGVTISKEQREKISAKLMGRKLPKLSVESRQKMSLAKKGKPLLARRGDKHPNWKGGITPVNAAIRFSLEYKIWREAVFQRDNYTCRFCLEKGGRLEADHIKSFSQFPELRFAIDNGRTLCKECHKKTDNYGGKKIKI